jgi:hypothetical protein
MDDIDAALPQTDLPPLLLLSGLLCDETVWEGVAPRLADIARIEMIAFAGLSSIEAMARRVLHNAPPPMMSTGRAPRCCGAGPARLARSDRRRNSGLGRIAPDDPR